MPLAKIDIAGSGDNTVIAAATGFRYLIRRLYLRAANTVTIKMRSATTDLSGAMPFVANDELMLDEMYSGQTPWFMTATGEAFNINLGGAVAVTGMVVYEKQPQT